MADIKDVAKMAGVSPSTVSRVLNGNTAVSPDKAARVRSAVEALDYTPNSVAKSLKSGRSNTIALMIPSIENLVYPEIVRGAEDCALKNGYTVILCNTDENKDYEKRYIRILRDRLVDGLLVASYTEGSEHIDALNEEGYPVVLLLRHGSPAFNYVGVDNFRWARQAVHHLLELGHRDIAIASGTVNVSLYKQRFQGYQKALEDYGIPFDESLIILDTNGPDSVRKSTQQLIQSGRKVDAIFGSNDYRAIVIMRTLYEMGIRVPDDISVMGFDDVRLASAVNPALTTVHQPLYDIGYDATKRLLKMIKKNKPLPPVNELKTAELALRESTKRRE